MITIDWKKTIASKGKQDIVNLLNIRNCVENDEKNGQRSHKTKKGRI